MCVQAEKARDGLLGSTFRGKRLIARLGAPDATLFVKFVDEWITDDVLAGMITSMFCYIIYFYVCSGRIVDERHHLPNGQHCPWRSR